MAGRKPSALEHDPPGRARGNAFAKTGIHPGSSPGSSPRGRLFRDHALMRFCRRRVAAARIGYTRGRLRGGDSMSTSTWIVLGIIAALIAWIIMIYNGLVAMRQRVNQSFADVDVQLKQRHDLIPNLVETVKGYASHERGTLEAVVQARNADGHAT